MSRGAFGISNFIERLVYAPLNGVMSGASSFISHANPFTKRGFIGKGKDYIKGLGNLSESQQFIGDTYNYWAGWHKRVTDPKRSLLGRAGTAVLGGAAMVGHTTLDLGAAAVGQLAQTGGHLVGGAAGLAVHGAMAATGAVVGGTFKAARRIGANRATKGAAKWMGKGLVKGAAGAAAEIATDAAGVAAVAGKTIWKNRYNPYFNASLIGGATLIGAAQGTRAYDINEKLGSITPGLSRASYLLDTSRGAEAPNPTGYSTMRNANPGVDNFGATGDLVFALNNIRQGGIL